jgi:hypothetical protein
MHLIQRQRGQRLRRSKRRTGSSRHLGGKQPLHPHQREQRPQRSDRRRGQGGPSRHYSGAQ